jgi:RimJ/RimL family protein N-acetyltransferase
MTEPFEAIRTARCRIAPLREQDAKAVLAITDASVTSRIDFLPDPFTLVDANALIARSDGERFFGVWDDLRAELKGVIGTHLKHDREIEIGYWFSASGRGQGLATEAVSALVTKLAASYPARRILAECHPDNKRSRTLLDRIGFASGGTAGHRPGRMLFIWNESAAYRFDVC